MERRVAEEDRRDSGGAASEARPEQCLDKGVDRDVRVTIGDDEGLSMLLDFYSGVLAVRPSSRRADR